MTPEAPPRPTGRLSRFAGADDRPVFIGACPRSGTTLLRTMLNAHPDLAIPRETRFLPVIWEARPRFGDLAEAANRRKLGRAIFRKGWTGARRLGVDPAVGIERLVAAPPTLGSLLGTCFQLYAETTGKSRWGDKRPMYARYLDAIFAMFPDAQFINVVRDPRAAVASMRKLEWFDGDIAPAVELWERSLRAVEPWRRRLRADQYVDIRYEDLVSDPAAALDRVTGFLGLASDGLDTMLSYHEAVDETATRYHWRLTQPPTTAAVRSWETALAPGEIAFVEKVTGQLMDGFGYDRSRAGGPVPAELERRHAACAADIARQRRELEREELKRLFIYRYPVRAQLTSGQRSGIRGPRMPPFWQRHVGKPR